MYDPHEEYNCNFSEEDWAAYQRSEKVLELAGKIRNLIDSGMVAVVRHNLLSDINFDIKSRVDYPAPILQESYYPHWAALALAMLTHACFKPFEEEGVTRFYKSPSPHDIFYPPNVEWKEDVYGHEHPVRKGTIKAEKMKQLEMFEF